MAGAYPFGDAVNGLGTLPGNGLHDGGRGRGGGFRGVGGRGGRIIGGLSGAAGAQHLPLLAAVAVHGDAFAAQFVGQHIGLRYIVHRGGVGEVDGLGNGVVGVFLGRALHPHVPLRGNVVGSAEDLFHPRRQIQPLQTAGLRHIQHQLLRVETLIAGHRLEVGVAFHQPGVVHHIADIGEGKQRLDAAGGAGDDADGAGRGDGGGRRIPHGLRRSAGAGAVVDAALPGRKDAAPAGQLRRGVGGALLHRVHHLPGQFQRPRRVVGDAHLNQQVGEPHHPQPDAAGQLAHLLDFGDGVGVHIDDIVQQMHRRLDSAFQPGPVDGDVVLLKGDHAGQVDGGQVAGFVGQQGLFAAGVGAFDFAQLRIGVVAVDAVDEHQAGVAGLPGHFRQQIEHFPGVEAAGGFAGARVHQIIVAPGLDPFHKVGVHRDGDVEVDQRLPVFLGADEAQDVGVGDPQDAHIGAPAGAALLDHIGGGVEGADEADRPAGDAAGGADHIALRAQAAEREAGAAAALVNQRRLLDLVEDFVQRIVHRQHEAGRQLLQLAPGVHQRRRVGHQLQAAHGLVEPLFGGLALRFAGAVAQIGLRQIAGHPAEHPVGVFQHLAVAVFGQVAAAQHHFGVGAEFGGTPVNPLGQAGGVQGGGDAAAAFGGGAGGEDGRLFQSGHFRNSLLISALGKGDDAETLGHCGRLRHRFCRRTRTLRKGRLSVSRRIFGAMGRNE